ncbi:MAG: hypothetical protein CMH27_05795 [Micavibrio sp.]|nr:hypothetical protein [Micavibrio sp.]|tara:strand:+ start:4503 stop:5057 length:555 start_codon:yes stop_codon:yes gene_type:complete
MSLDNKAMKVMFTISVILNVLALGAAGGMVYKQWSHAPYRALSSEMSPEGHNIVARTMQTAFKEGRGDMKKARAIKKQISQILSAKDFDAEAFDAKAETLHKIMSNMGKRRIDVTRDLAADLSQADRKVLAERFEKGFHGHDKKSRKKKPHAFMKEDQDRIKKGVRPLSGPDLPDDMPPPPSGR